VTAARVPLGRFLRWLAVVWLLCGAALGAAQDLVPVPPLQGRVTDLTGTLTAPQSAALEQRCARSRSARARRSRC
jgi:uncharacterized protein